MGKRCKSSWGAFVGGLAVWYAKEAYKNLVAFYTIPGHQIYFFSPKIVLLIPNCPDNFTVCSLKIKFCEKVLVLARPAVQFD